MNNKEAWTLAEVRRLVNPQTIPWWTNGRPGQESFPAHFCVEHMQNGIGISQLPKKKNRKFHHLGLFATSKKWVLRQTTWEIFVWLVVSTHLKNISQNGNLPQIGVNIKNIWNHQPVCLWNPRNMLNSASKGMPIASIKSRKLLLLTSANMTPEFRQHEHGERCALKEKQKCKGRI